MTHSSRHGRHRLRGSVFALLLLLGALLSGTLTERAHAWSNGGECGNGFGTHDWVLYEADRLAESRGYHWLRLGAALRATDDPDTRLHDTYHHVYDVWGSTYGDAPERVQELFTRAVRHLRAGRPRAASGVFGLLAHYYADICNPTHTDGSALEDGMHSRHESATNTRTDAKGEHRSWVRFDGIQVRRGAYDPAKRAATYAHQYYWELVRTYSRKGWVPSTATITRRCLSRAANDLADLLVSARRAAR